MPKANATAKGQKSLSSYFGGNSDKKPAKKIEKKTVKKTVQEDSDEEDVESDSDMEDEEVCWPTQACHSENYFGHMYDAAEHILREFATLLYIISVY